MEKKTPGRKSTHEFAFETNYRIIEKKNIVNNLIKRSYTSISEVTFKMLFQHFKKRASIG